MKGNILLGLAAATLLAAGAGCGKSDNTTLQARLEALERTVAAQEKQHEGMKKKLSAGTFEVVDLKGQARAALGMGEDGCPALTVFDQDRRPRLTLTVTPEGFARLRLAGTEDQAGLSLVVKPFGDAGMSFYDKDGKELISLGLGSEEPPHLHFLDAAAGRPRIKLAMSRDGMTGLTLHSKEGKMLSRFTAMADDSSGVWLMNSGEDLRAGLTSTPAKGGNLVTFDETGRLFWSTMSN